MFTTVTTTNVIGVVAPRNATIVAAPQVGFITRGHFGGYVVFLVKGEIHHNRGGLFFITLQISAFASTSTFPNAMSLC